MRHRFCLLALLAVGLVASARSAEHPTKPSESSEMVPLIENLGDLEHRVTTTKPLAQQYFNQGLRLIYAFNHDEAIRAFQAAAKIDPTCAMAQWGIALSLGPNYNLAAEEERAVGAYKAIVAAQKLVAGASPPEAAYIDALSKRYAETYRARTQAARSGLRERDAQARGPISRRPGRRRAVRRVAHGPAAVGPVDRRRRGPAGHRRDRGHVGRRAAEKRKASRRESLLHPRRRSLDRARARFAERAAFGRSDARCRPPGAHALAHLLPSRAAMPTPSNRTSGPSRSTASTSRSTSPRASIR